MRLGSHCSAPVIYPRVVLPAGVEFDKTQAIKCYYTPPGQAQRQVTHAGECPQWANISANGYYSNSVSGWGGGWPLPSVNGNNGSAWEFHNNQRLKSRPYFMPSSQEKPRDTLNIFGATLGALVGAGTGAAIDGKNRGRGAAIGAAVGLTALAIAYVAGRVARRGEAGDQGDAHREACHLVRQ